MKNIVRVALFAVLAFSFSACGSFSKPPEDFLKQQVQIELRHTKDLNNVEISDITIVGFTDQGSYKKNGWPDARIARVRATVRGQEQPISMLVVYWKNDRRYIGHGMREDYLNNK